ncbi:MAG TPA: hypothetical protein VGA61_04435 [Anaerolineae bacterium]
MMSPSSEDQEPKQPRYLTLEEWKLILRLRSCTAHHLLQTIVVSGKPLFVHVEEYRLEKIGS